MALQARGTTLSEWIFCLRSKGDLIPPEIFLRKRNLISISHLVASGGQPLPKKDTQKVLTD
jgi:hypothetical protein